MTWDELGQKIAAMGTAQRYGAVRFVGPDDKDKVWDCALEQAGAGGIEDADGDCIFEDDFYLTAPNCSVC